MLDVHDVWVGAVVGLVRGGVGASADPAALVAAIDACPEVDGTVDPDDADLVELAFEVVRPTWEAVGAVDSDRRLTVLGVWGPPRARWPEPGMATSTPPELPLDPLRQPEVARQTLQAERRAAD